MAEKKESLGETSATTIVGAVLAIVMWLSFGGCDYITAKYKGEKISEKEF